MASLRATEGALGFSRETVRRRCASAGIAFSRGCMGGAVASRRTKGPCKPSRLELAQRLSIASGLSAGRSHAEIASIPAPPGISWDSPVDGKARQPMEQCASRILLRGFEARAGEGKRTQDERRGEAGYLQVHRTLLQQAKDAFWYWPPCPCDLVRDAA